MQIYAISTKKERREFIEVGYHLNADLPHWIPPLRSDMLALISRHKNPFFDHAQYQLFLARNGNGKAIGRISAHIDELAIAQPTAQGMGKGTGNWGLLEAKDEATAHALIQAAENWLHEQGMHRVLAPLSLSIWDEPGLLTKGSDHPPTIMMGHHAPSMEKWIENAQYKKVKSLYTYDLDIRGELPPLIRRVIRSGKRNKRINIRPLNMKNYTQDAETILNILNDAWSSNWGFVPLTPKEIAYISKKLKPIAFPDLVMIAELDGVPSAFMITLPDLNEALRNMQGKLLPFNWVKLLLWLHKPKVRTMRVPLMGVLKEHQNTQLASQLALMLIGRIRKNSVEKFDASRSEIGWILDDNKGMRSIAESIGSKINREYKLYDKNLDG